jgi:hypothetical protein
VAIPLTQVLVAPASALLLQPAVSRRSRLVDRDVVVMRRRHALPVEDPALDQISGHLRVLRAVFCSSHFSPLGGGLVVRAVASLFGTGIVKPVRWTRQYQVVGHRVTAHLADAHYSAAWRSRRNVVRSLTPSSATLRPAMRPFSLMADVTSAPW